MIKKHHRHLAKKFRVLGHPVRIKLLEELMVKECCVGDIQKCLSVSQPNVSQHLKILREAGIIESRREKNRICYSVADKNLIKVINYFSEREE